MFRPHFLLHCTTHSVLSSSITVTMYCYGDDASRLSLSNGLFLVLHKQQVCLCCYAKLTFVFHAVCGHSLTLINLSTRLSVHVRIRLMDATMSGMNRSYVIIAVCLTLAVVFVQWNVMSYSRPDLVWQYRNFDDRFACTFARCIDGTMLLTLRKQHIAVRIAVFDFEATYGIWSVLRNHLSLTCHQNILQRQCSSFPIVRVVIKLNWR